MLITKLKKLEFNFKLNFGHYRFNCGFIIDGIYSNQIIRLKYSSIQNELETSLMLTFPNANVEYKKKR